MAILQMARSCVPRPVKRVIKGGLRLLAARDAPSQVAIRRLGSFEVAYRANTADEAVLASSFDRDTFFAGVPEYQPAPSDVILDVGAHIGTFAVLAASRVPQGRVHAVEACEDSFNYLRINIGLNGLGNVCAYHLALSDRKGETRLHYSEGNWGHSIVKQLSRRGETVPTDTLASFTRQNGIDVCHFAKFNCEGAEFPILLAASPDALARFRTMLVLYHCDLAVGHDQSELIRHLEASGFDTLLRNRSEDRGWIIATRRPA